jgi:3-hydroxyisobutyrate dehydrogenase
MSEAVGYVGLGIMGMGMARNLLKAGFPLSVWNRTASKAEALAAEGATARATPAEVAANSDIIVICVSDTPMALFMASSPVRWSLIAALSAPRPPKRWLKN